MKIRIKTQHKEQKLSIRLINEGNEDLKKFTKREFGNLQKQNLKLPFQAFNL